jgi:16S rRNA (adenine1518-N6/adenine1519-N6)-dimethyltransferase
MYTKKSLGQHFLNSDRAIKTIYQTAELGADDIVLEIGPGKGVLTEKLITLSGKVIAVEKDDDLCEFLKVKFADAISHNRLDLLNRDILDLDPNIFEFYKDDLTYKLVANIPYNITGAILKKFLSADYQPERMVLLVQKEVAERIARDKKGSILSISIKVYGKPKYIETVKAGSFNPPPKVDSAIISIENISKEFFHKFSESAFFKLLNAGFRSKRKKLSSNLSEIYPKEDVLTVFKSLNLSENIRAEEISTEVWKKLATALIKD